MQDIIKHVMGEAAKSNVEKRKVGCVITLDDKIIATGHNTEELHAEAAACEELCASDDWPKYKQVDGGGLKAWVSHPPCPECAKTLADHGITDVEVVEEFMKFDGDKLRYDLVDGDFMLHYEAVTRGTNLSNTGPFSFKSCKRAFWALSLAGAIRLLATNPLDVEERLARVLTFGARKYKPNNWRKNTDVGRYWAAAHRHLNAILKGETHDPESGFEHLDHLWCNIMFIWVLDKDARNNSTDSTN